MQKKELIFSNECEFSKQEKELINAIYYSFFIPVVNGYNTDYKKALEELLTIQNIFQSKIESLKSNKITTFDSDPYYQFRKEIFDRLFDIFCDKPASKSIKVFEYINDSLTNLCVDTFIKGLNNGSIKEKDLENG